MCCRENQKLWSKLRFLWDTWSNFRSRWVLCDDICNQKWGFSAFQEERLNRVVHQDRTYTQRKHLYINLQVDHLLLWLRQQSPIICLVGLQAFQVSCRLKFLPILSHLLEWHWLQAFQHFSSSGLLKSNEFSLDCQSSRPMLQVCNNPNQSTELEECLKMDHQKALYPHHWIDCKWISSHQVYH